MKVFLSKSERQRHYRNFRIKIYLIFGSAIFAVIMIAYLMQNFSLFKIKKIETVGQVQVDYLRPKVLSSRFSQFLGFNNFLSWPDKIGKIIVQKNYFTGVLTLNLPSQEKFAIWCATDCFWIGEDGIVLDAAPDTEGAAIIKIRDGRDFSPQIGQAVLEEALLTNLIKIVRDVSDSPIAIQDFSFNQKLEELTVNGARGERIIFSLRFSPSAKTFSYLHDLITTGKLKTAEYVDLTVENRIYLKPR